MCAVHLLAPTTFSVATSYHHDVEAGCTFSFDHHVAQFHCTATAPPANPITIRQPNVPSAFVSVFVSCSIVCTRRLLNVRCCIPFESPRRCSPYRERTLDFAARSVALLEYVCFPTHRPSNTQNRFNWANLPSHMDYTKALLLREKGGSV